MRNRIWAAIGRLGAAAALCALLSCASQTNTVAAPPRPGEQVSGTLRAGQTKTLFQSGRETVIRSGLSMHGKVAESSTSRSIDFSREELSYLGLGADGRAKIQYRVLRGPLAQETERKEIAFDAQGATVRIERGELSLGPADVETLRYQAIAAP